MCVFFFFFPKEYGSLFIYSIYYFVCYRISDINECENSTLNSCPNKSDCQNINGGYNCNKKKTLRTIIIGMPLF